MNKSCSFFNRTIKNLDDFECNLQRFTANLYYYDFGYYTMAPLFLILIITIFGKFHGNYRWFILNQVFWDFLITCDYGCVNRIRDRVKEGPACFYLASTYWNEKDSDIARVLTEFVYQLILNTPFSALLLLTTSRFLALYFPFLYDRLTHGRRILWSIIIFNFVTILIFDTSAIFTYLKKRRAADVLGIKDCSTIFNTNPICKNDTMWAIYDTIYRVVFMSLLFKPCLFILISCAATLAIIWKISKQAKFQSKHNRNDFNASVRIAIVLGLQTLMNIFLFVVEIYNRFFFMLSFLLNWKIISGYNYDDILGNLGYYKKYGYLDVRLPRWFDSEYGVVSNGPRQMIVQFRILIESLIILGIMTGYRECLIDLVKFAYVFVKRTFEHCSPKVSSTTMY